MTLQEAIAFHQQGKVAEAEAAYENILRAQPNHPGALSLLGLLLLNGGRAASAAEVLGKAVAANPADAAAKANLAAARKSMAAEALNSSAAWHGQKRYEEALAAALEAQALDPQLVGAHANAGWALHRLRRYDEAFAAFDRATTLDPTDPVARHYRGMSLFALGRLEEADDNFTQALALDPAHVIAHFDRALCRLTLGRWAEGWEEYEWRKRRPEPLGVWSGDGAVWSGREEIAGKTLVIHAEQGLGDTLLLCRYVPLAEARSARVVVLAPPPLHRLLRTLSATVTVTHTTEGLGAIDYTCATFSLPHVLGGQPMSTTVPYLRATPDAVGAWRARVGTHGFKIGVCWGVMKDNEPTRSFRLALLAEIARLPTVRLISLQKGEELEQLVDLPPGMSVENLGGEYDSGDFLDTAAVMANLDLIISCDTSVANLGGALGCRTWVALRRVPEWRWSSSGSTTPWFPTARVFRQRTDGDWAPVFAEMEAELRSVLRAHQSPA